MGIVSKVRGRVLIDQIRVGLNSQSDAFKSVEFGSLSIAPGTIAAGARGTVAVAVTGAGTADLVTVYPPSNLDAGLVPVGAAVAAPGTVSVYIAVPGTAEVIATSKTWRYRIDRPAS